ncbi:MAG: beta-galactosidase, partial [Armatimonadetes bacterium]|nr:beta-galactosidase [Armatimonadota bacterium]
PREIELAALHQGPPWTSYMSGEECVYIQQVRLAAKAGVHLHQFISHVPWPREGEQVSYAGLDKAMRDTVANDPRALVMLRFGVEPPGWWLEQHPDERTTYEDGSKTQVSVASQLWLDELMPKLEDFVRHCEEKWGDRLLVYFPSAQHTGEWFYPGVWTRHFPGFSPAMTRAFRAWLKKKYGTAEKLSTAWGREVARFDEVEVPTVEQRTTGGVGEFFDPARDRYQTDFFDFMNDTMAGAVQRIAATIKKASGRRKPVMFFYGYLYSLSPTPAGLNHSGHLRLDRLLRDPNIDIFCSPIDYFDRQPGGVGHFMTTAESIAAHGKMWFDEDDTRTYLTAEDAGFGRCATLAESQGVHQRNFAQIFPRRMGCWYMDLGNAGWLNSPYLWSNIAKLRRLWEQHADEPVDYAPQIAVIADTRSPLYVRSRSAVNAALVSHLRAQIARLGAPVGYWLLEDFLEGKVKPARLYMFQNIFVLTAAERARIRQILREQKATALWFYAPGFIDPEGARASEDFISDLTGIAVRRLDKPIKDLALPVQTSELAKGVEDHLGSQNTGLKTQWAVVASEGIEPLATYADQSELIAAAAARDYDGFRSIYVAPLHAPAAMLRNIARAAGVWVFCDSNDVVLGDVRPGGRGRFLALAASSDGEKVLHLPRAARVVDCLTGAVVTKGQKVSLKMKKGQVRLLWLAD